MMSTGPHVPGAAWERSIARTAEDHRCEQQGCRERATYCVTAIKPGAQRKTWCCSNHAAALSHQHGIRHPAFNPEGRKS